MVYWTVIIAAAILSLAGSVSFLKQLKTGLITTALNDNFNWGLYFQGFFYVKKPECPVLCTGMNGQCGFGGVSPQAFKAFSLEEAPTFGRSSSLRALHLLDKLITVIGIAARIGMND